MSRYSTRKSTSSALGSGARSSSVSSRRSGPSEGEQLIMAFLLKGDSYLRTTGGFTRKYPITDIDESMGALDFIVEGMALLSPDRKKHDKPPMTDHMTTEEIHEFLLSTRQKQVINPQFLIEEMERKKRQKEDDDDEEESDEDEEEEEEEKEEEVQMEATPEATPEKKSKAKPKTKSEPKQEAKPETRQSPRKRKSTASELSSTNEPSTSEPSTSGPSTSTPSRASARTRNQSSSRQEPVEDQKPYKIPRKSARN